MNGSPRSFRGASAILQISPVGSCLAKIGWTSFRDPSARDKKAGFSPSGCLPFVAVAAVAAAAAAAAATAAASRQDAPRSARFRDPSAKPSAILPRKINQSIVDSAVLSFWIMACRAVPWTILPRNLPRNLPQSFRDPSAAAAAAKQCPQQHHHHLMQSFREPSAEPVVSTQISVTIQFKAPPIY